MAGRPQRRAECRRHAAYPLRPAGRPQLPLPARAGDDHRRLACARPARHRQRQLFGQGPVRARRARARRATCRTSGGRRGRSTRSARHCLYAQRLLQRDLGARTADAGDLYRAGARKHSRSAPTVMARNNSVQREVGPLEAKLSAARAFLHEAAGQVYDASATGTLDVDLRLRLRLRHHLRHERGDRRLDRLLSRPPARRRSRRRRPSSAASATR